jgi:hypothetical protein
LSQRYNILNDRYHRGFVSDLDAPCPVRGAPRGYLNWSSGVKYGIGDEFARD